MHCTQAVEIFSNVSMPFGTLLEKLVIVRKIRHDNSAKFTERVPSSFFPLICGIKFRFRYFASSCYRLYNRMHIGYQLSQAQAILKIKGVIKDFLLATE